MSINKPIIAILPLLVLIYFLIKIPYKSYIKSFFNEDSPQLVLVLGGDLDREERGVKLAKIMKIPLIISSGSNPEYATWSIKQLGLDEDQFILDYRAKDTLTNFTTLVDDLEFRGIKHALLITSSDHMVRAKNVGNIISGSRGIKLTSISVPCEPNCQEESYKKIVIDILRSIIWVVTGQDVKQSQEIIPNKVRINSLIRKQT